MMVAFINLRWTNQLTRDDTNLKTFFACSCQPESLAMCLWTHRKGEDAGVGKIMWGKIMRNFYDFARHDFAAVFIRNRECQVEALSRKSLMIGVPARGHAPLSWGAISGS
jgi:hypothetical protein